MLWDCPACGADRLLALDHRFCPGCGSPQDPELRYFPADDAKVAVEDHPYHGADKVCPACDTPNSAASDFCQACGSPLSDAAEAKRRRRVETAEGESFQGESATDAKSEARERKQAEKQERLQAMQGGGPPEPPPRKGKASLLGLGCVGAIGVAVLGVALFCLLSWLWASTGEVQVQGHEWQRQIQIEAFGPTQQTAWRNELPTGARDLRCTQEERSSRRVEDGEDCKTVREDKGDGTFAEVRECKPRFRKEPIYDERCRYTIDTWTLARSEQAGGQNLEPEWPSVNLAGSQEREGRRTETYRVRLIDEQGTTHTCELSEARWRGLRKGQTVEASFGGLTGAIDCSSLAP